MTTTIGKHKNWPAVIIMCNLQLYKMLGKQWRLETAQYSSGRNKAIEKCHRIKMMLFWIMHPMYTNSKQNRSTKFVVYIHCMHNAAIWPLAL